jgi:WD40 repeat protein
MDADYSLWHTNSFFFRYANRARLPHCHLLSNGTVLITGGASRQDPICAGGISSAELYNPATSSFSSTMSMASRRYSHTATLLPNGNVLVLGGYGSGKDCDDLGESAELSAELFNTTTASFSPAGNLLTGRGAHTATLLPDGKILVTGGGDEGGATLPFYGSAISSAEIYDPSSRSSVATGNMDVARYGHTATALPNGKVLIVGGFSSYFSNPSTTCELYDQTTGSFTPTGQALVPRAGHTATLLSNGKVLIAGGMNSGIIDGEIGVTASAELYDPATGTFSTTGSMGLPREEFSATLLPNGTVILAGGNGPTAELYDPVAGSFTPAASMEESRFGLSATLLQDGTVLVAGGGVWAALSSAELYK